MNRVPAPGADEDRKRAQRQRLAAALRANLSRRKAQGRERQAAQAGREQQGRVDEGQAISQVIANDGACPSESDGPRTTR